SRARSMRRPSSRVPLVLARSRTHQPLDSRRSSACWRETARTATVRSAEGSRPTTIAGEVSVQAVGSSGWFSAYSSRRPADDPSRDVSRGSSKECMAPVVLSTMDGRAYTAARRACIPGGMSSSLRVAAVQLNSQQDLTQNLANVAAEVRAAAERGAKLVVLPENFAYMGSEVDKRAFAEELPSRDAPIQSCLRQLAEQHRVALLAGGFPERSGDPLRPFNTCVAYGPDGSLLGAYRKIHLFDVDLPD